jgi:hypothetical protein
MNRATATADGALAPVSGLSAIVDRLSAPGGEASTPLCASNPSEDF